MVCFFWCLFFGPEWKLLAVILKWMSMGKRLSLWTRYFSSVLCLSMPLFLFNINYFFLNFFSKVPCLLANLILLCLFSSASTESLYSLQLLLPPCILRVVHEFTGLDFSLVTCSEFYFSLSLWSIICLYLGAFAFLLLSMDLFYFPVMESRSHNSYFLDVFFPCYSSFSFMIINVPLPSTFNLHLYCSDVGL